MLSGAIWALFWDHFIQQIHNSLIWKTNASSVGVHTTWAGENQTQAGEREILENSPQSGRSPGAGELESLRIVWFGQRTSCLLLHTPWFPTEGCPAPWLSSYSAAAFFSAARPACQLSSAAELSPPYGSAAPGMPIGWIQMKIPMVYSMPGGGGGGGSSGACTYQWHIYCSIKNRKIWISNS